MRTQSLQQYVGRDLEEDIRHEKDGQSDISLLAHEMQLRWQTHGQGIGYVDSGDLMEQTGQPMPSSTGVSFRLPIQEGCHIDDEQDRYHPEVNLPQQRLLVD